MGWIYLRQASIVIRKKWWIGILVVMMSIALFLFMAKMKIEDKQKTELQYVGNLEKFEADLQIYDDLILDLETSIENNQEMIDDLQEYIDNSVYMKLDSNNIYVANIQYIIKSDNYALVQRAIETYINEGKLKSQISAQYEAVAEKYLEEIISCTTNGNVLSISVMHYEEENAKELALIVEKCLLDYKSVISEAQSEFSFEKLDFSNYVKADSSVLTAQNTQRNNLKNYQSALAEIKKKLADQRINKDTFVEKYKPYYFETSDKRILILHLLAGIATGVVVTIAIYVLMVFMGDKIKSVEDLHSLKVNVLETIHLPTRNNDIDNKKYLKSLAAHMETSEIFFDVLGNSSLEGELLECYSDRLEQEQINMLVGYNLSGDALDLKKLLCAGCCVLVIEIGRTTYSEVQEHVSLCQKYGIPVLGSIVINSN